MLHVAAVAPDFNLPDQNSVNHKLSDYIGQWVLLYFYPKDDTPGCTTEACSVQENLSKFEQLHVIVLGISADPVQSHQNFAQKYGLHFTLLSDSKKDTISAYEAGGIFTKRISYLIDPHGKIFKAYNAVDPDTHVATVLADLESVKASE
ncbi:MAG: peroxiredoxin [Candidatus Magasanikbacteria bacterium]|nr:peroxiredoxin [Candidatus Magasanikbacteria bacterium]